VPAPADAGDLVPQTFLDAFRKRRTISPRARAAVLEVLGPDPPDPVPPVLVARRGASLPLPGELRLEDGTALGRVSAVPPDAPYGYHELVRDDGRRHRLITGPGRCHLPDGLRAWGWAIQLSTTRSRRSWGIGDLADLQQLAAWSASVGAGFMTVSPLGAPNPGPDPEPSPYYASTRRFGNPLHVSCEDLPGVGRGAHSEAGHVLNDDRLVDRRRSLALKLETLEAAWRRGAFDRAAFDRWRAARGETLERWATFAVLSERFGTGWRSWPDAYRRPDAPAVRSAAQESAERVAFHAWVQWRFDLQLAAASQPLRRVADMPVSVDPGGFDAWDWQDQLAPGITIGVPPDRFNLIGQDWGMPAFHPYRLREAGYAPFIETVRAQLRHAGGLRIDHVLGLFRLWWIPHGVDSADGAYVRQPTTELLEIVALESERAGAPIIGEDLGTVPAGVRPELRRRRILSTRLAYFERRPPDRYPVRVLAAVTTHDLPTIAGAWSGADLRDQASAGRVPDAAGLVRLRERLLIAAGLPSSASLDDLVVGIHRALAVSPAALVAATLEDALLVTERPNIPGTVRPERDNWSLALPIPIEDLGGDLHVAAVVQALRRGGTSAADGA